MSKKYCDLEITVTSQSRSLKVVPYDRLDKIFYQCSILPLSLRRTIYLDIRLQICKPGYGSVKVIENVTIRYSVYDFLFTLHSNLGPISYLLFRDRLRFPSEIAKFFPPLLYFAPPLKGFPLQLGIGAWRQWTNVTDGRTYRETDTGPEQIPRIA